LPPRPQLGSNHAWHLYVVRLTSAAKCGRDDLIGKLSERGIGTSVHFIPLHRQPYWRDRYALLNDQFPATEQAYQSMLSLPLYTRMTDADQQRVIDEVRAALS
jgi:dTDP-4-amino-4,6-dideoxygalactose transaminase